jgi:RNA polymerase sigma-70 factor (ECF subfamily)
VDAGASTDSANVSEEAALVAALRAGEGAAFDRTYSMHNARVFSFLLRLSGRRDIAEDLAQETWIKLAKAAPRLREDTRLLPFLFTVARNAFVSWRRWAMLDLSRLVMFGFEVDEAEAPDALHDRAEEIAILERALQSVPVASREVLLLVGVEGFEQEEAAAILDISYAALRKRLSRARADLQTAIDRTERERRAHERPGKTTA